MSERIISLQLDLGDGTTEIAQKAFRAGEEDADARWVKETTAALQAADRHTIDGLTRLHRQALEACWAVEAIPASEQQTAASLKVSALAQRIQVVLQRAKDLDKSAG